MKSLDGSYTKKYKSKDLQHSEYSSSLATDVEKVFLDVDLPTYPVAVTIDYTIHCTDNAIAYPTFLPVVDYDVAVNDASYSVSFPEAVKLRHVCIGKTVEPQVTTDAKGKTQWTFAMTGIEPIAREKFAKPLSELVAKVYILPEQLDFYGTRGSMKTWEDFGKWIGDLCSGQDVLPEEAKAKVHALTDTCQTDYGKVKALYDFLRQTTRYVSIQLGIGGYKPLPAAYVWRTGFGDCKALTNYMKALLAEAGVPSSYTLISTDYRDLLALPNFQQLNHVILKVPVANRVIWMECTNPELPLGYTHDDIAGHDAIEITSQGGKRVKLDDYPDSLNMRNTEVVATLQTDGVADMTIVDRFDCHSYGYRYGWRKKSEKDRLDFANSAYELASGKITKLECGYEPYYAEVAAGVVPSSSVTVEASGVKVANASGARLFVPAYLFHRHYSKDVIAKGRKQDVRLNQGLKSCERVSITLPQGMSVESLPRSVSVSNEIGSFSSSVEVNGGCVVVTSSYELHRGTYSAEKAALIDELDNARYLAYGSKLILRKN